MIEFIISAGILYLAFRLLKTMPNAEQEKHNKNSQASADAARAEAEYCDYKHLFNQEFSEN